MKKSSLLPVIASVALAAWLSADTKPGYTDGVFPANAARGAVIAERTDAGGWELRYYRTPDVTLEVTAPTLSDAADNLAELLIDIGTTETDLRAIGEDLEAIAETMGGSL